MATRPSGRARGGRQTERPGRSGDQAERPGRGGVHQLAGVEDLAVEPASVEDLAVEPANVGLLLVLPYCSCTHEQASILAGVELLAAVEDLDGEKAKGRALLSCRGSPNLPGATLLPRAPRERKPMRIRVLVRMKPCTWKKCNCNREYGPYFIAYWFKDRTRCQRSFGKKPPTEEALRQLELEVFGFNTDDYGNPVHVPRRAGNRLNP